MMHSSRIVLTFSSGSLSGLAQALPGITVDEVPLLSFTPPDDWTPVDHALERLAEFRAVAVTSPRAARAVSVRAAERGWQFDAAVPVWVTGVATASALNGVFGLPRLAAGDDGADGAGAALARAMIAAGVQSPALYPCGEVHREELPAILAEAGIAVQAVTCYRSVLADEAAARSAIAGADVVVIGSSRVAELLAGIPRSGPRPALLALGHSTAAAARDAGWPPDAVAARPTSEALAECVRQLTLIG
jgi:uroporphyrinogen-III synthase